MKICFTLDDVLRAKTQQIGTVYKKFVNENTDLENLNIDSPNLAEALELSAKEYNDFLYKDYPFEVFAEAPVTEKMVDKNFNLWLLKNNVDAIIANPMEFNTSIGFTCFFLSQIATRVREFYFPADSRTIWDRCDVLVTAYPDLIDFVPDGKVVVKINTDYNKNNKGDFEYNKLSEILSDDDFLNKISKKLEEKAAW